MSQTLMDLVKQHPRNRRIKRTYRITSPFTDSHKVTLVIPKLDADEDAVHALSTVIRKKKVALYLFGYGILLGCYDDCVDLEDGSVKVTWDISQEDVDNIRVRLGKQPLVVMFDCKCTSPQYIKECGWTFYDAHITTKSFAEQERVTLNDEQRV